MGAIRKYANRVVVELEVERLINAPVVLKTRANQVHCLEHSVSEVISNLLWYKLCSAHPEMGECQYEKVVVTFNKEKGAYLAEFFPTSEGGRLPPDQG